MRRNLLWVSIHGLTQQASRRMFTILLFFFNVYAKIHLWIGDDTHYKKQYPLSINLHQSITRG